ncbi:hypothetical protein MKEN_00251400 [Mycena kentingensis (nom. inval.)]|nr:hypothetical protein MKEN_00251400 [Mycena kentingensis (nom. inval.)]
MHPMRETGWLEATHVYAQVDFLDMPMMCQVFGLDQEQTLNQARTAANAVALCRNPCLPMVDSGFFLLDLATIRRLLEPVGQAIPWTSVTKPIKVSLVVNETYAATPLHVVSLAIDKSDPESPVIVSSKIPTDAHELIPSKRKGDSPDDLISLDAVVRRVSVQKAQWILPDAVDVKYILLASIRRAERTGAWNRDVATPEQRETLRMLRLLLWPNWILTLPITSNPDGAQPSGNHDDAGNHDGDVASLAARKNSGRVGAGGESARADIVGIDAWRRRVDRDVKADGAAATAASAAELH